MKEVPLSRHGKNKGGFVALVDDDDFESLNKYEWHARNVFGGHWYATRNEWRDGTNTLFYMHRVVW